MAGYIREVVRGGAVPVSCIGGLGSRAWYLALWVAAVIPGLPGTFLTAGGCGLSIKTAVSLGIILWILAKNSCGLCSLNFINHWLNGIAFLMSLVAS